jgi:hypothetical protein
MNELQTVESYELFVYGIKERYPQVRTSTLVLKRTGALFAELTGSLSFENNIRLVVRERLDFKTQLIRAYSYEVWRGKEKLYWYDPQPHPGDPKLASTHPHHKHVPPNLKHNRIPTPGLTFDSPNLPLIIQEIIDNLL